MPASSIDRSLVSDQVFRVLCEGILSGEYAPGEKLPTQRTIAAALGVNMAPVREAVKRLEQLRLVEVRQGDAMRVRDWRSHGGLDVVGHVLFGAAGLDRPTLSAVMEARRAMLAEVSRLACERRTETQADSLLRIAAEIAAASDPQTAQTLDFAFFSDAVQASGNLVFVLIMNTIRDLYFSRAELFRAVVSDHRELAPLYARVATGIADRDPEAAVLAVSELAGEQELRLRAALG